MFLKQYNYKPRSGSQSSGTEASGSQQQQQQAAAPASPAGQSAGVSAAIAGRRRSSATDGQFAGLTGYKRNSQEMKRPDYAEQQGQTGVLGQMWNNFTKGK